jgi:hypothetical protein
MVSGMSLKYLSDTDLCVLADNIGDLVPRETWVLAMDD